jgi:hypothetical protein
MPKSKPATLKLKKSAASVRSPCLRLLTTQQLHRRVVTQQKRFFHSVVRSDGLPRASRKLAAQPRTLLLSRLPAGRS